ncbi:tRNA (adenosine(37)-N6)-threonylcarbamoyltransferase complex dimerization subunit type 1 TsaB, partial [Candidatus Woesearchaeota archaeon]|nr:tRNA (adenosine(37)-N6)-threonylcarbamoyltransferase complex dimerization subunit type 1 TsaB [Candidatus Woesearchaeota archaeon]
MADKIFLAIQGTYNSLGLALFNGGTCIAETSSSDQRASSHLVPYLETFLSSYSLALPDLLFIAVDQGPGAFTSLRVTIATVNGIAFGLHKPLVGVDSLDALAWQARGGYHPQPGRDHLLVMLNAYGNDVYYRYAHEDSVDRGCKPAEPLLADIASHSVKASLALAGNGVPMHLSAISHALDGR